MTMYWKALKRLRPTGRDSGMLLAGAALALLVVGGIRVIQQEKTPISYNPAGISAQWIPATVRHWNSIIVQMAQRYDVDPNVIAILMTMESGGNASARSEDNALGLMQVTPPTAKDIAAKFLKKPVTAYNLLDPATNIEFGTAYIAYLRDQFGEANQAPSWDGAVELVAAGYNGGPGAASNLEHGKGLADTQTVVYSRDAFNMWRERVSKDSPTFDRWKERGGTTLLEAAATSQKQR